MTAQQPQPLIARAQLVEMYQRYPGALAEEVARVLRPLADDEDRVKHNAALSRFIVLFPTAESERHLWENLARVIVETAIQEPVGAKQDGENRETRSIGRFS